MMTDIAAQFLDAAELAARLPWPTVLDALERAIPSAFGSERFVDRMRVPAAGGELLLMPAAATDAVGVKLVGIGLANEQRGLPRIQALYILFDGQSLSPVAILDGTSLTTIRTAGQSAMIVRRLAAPDARRLVVFGAGPQADAHVHAMCSVRPIDSVRIVGRRTAPVAALCAELASEHLDVRPGTPDDVSAADIVVCATNSSTPVFNGALLAIHSVVVAIGSHTANSRELDDTVFSRASLVLVEHRATALREAGDVIQAIASGSLSEDRIRDFADLAAGRLQLTVTGGISVYKSVGMGYQDLAVATAAFVARKT